MEQLLIGAVYIASRSLGKISGSYVSCKATRCSEKIQKYLGITLPVSYTHLTLPTIRLV